MTVAPAISEPGDPAETAEETPSSFLRALPSRRSAQTVWSVVDQGVVSGTSFVSSVLVGRLCSQDDLGIYAMALSVLLMARGVQGMAVSSPYMVYAQRRRGEDRATYTGSCLLHYALVTLLVVAAVLALAGILALRGSGSGLVTTLVAVSLAVPFVLLRDHLRQLSFSDLKVGHALLVDVCVATVQLGWLALLAWQGRLSVPAVYTAMAVGCGVAAAGWFLLLRVPLAFDLSEARMDWRTNWSFGRWTLGSQFLSQGMAYLMPWVIAAVHGEAATGLMAACITIVNLMGTFVSGISNVLTPRAAAAYADGGTTLLRRVLMEFLLVFVTCVGLFCLVLLLTGDYFATLIYGEQYAGSGSVLVVLGLQLLVNTIGITAGNGLWALDRPRANFQADVLMLIVSAIVVVPFIGPWGVLGAAISLLCGTIAGTIARCATLLSELTADAGAAMDFGEAA